MTDAAPGTWEPARTGRRIAAVLVDLFLVAGAMLTIGYIVAGGADQPVPGWLRPSLAVVGIGYFVAFEGFTGRTPGKRLFGLRVVRLLGEDAEPDRHVGAVAALVRKGWLFLGFLVPVLAAGPLMTFLLLLAITSTVMAPDRRGMHDRLARTAVVAA